METNVRLMYFVRNNGKVKKGLFYLRCTNGSYLTDAKRIYEYLLKTHQDDLLSAHILADVVKCEHITYVKGVFLPLKYKLILA